VEEPEEEVQPVIPTDTPAPTETSTPTPTNTPEPDLGPEWIQIGQTYNGKPIEIVRFGAGPKKIVLVGGLHAGFAPATVVLGERLVSHFTDNPKEVPAGVTVYVIPSVNKDSVQNPGEWLGRANGNKVDLNRNWDCNWQPVAMWGEQRNQRRIATLLRARESCLKRLYRRYSTGGRGFPAQRSAWRLLRRL
jgi:murein tripeptide amidase MpaA